MLTIFFFLLLIYTFFSFEMNLFASLDSWTILSMSLFVCLLK